MRIIIICLIFISTHSVVSQNSYIVWDKNTKEIPLTKYQKKKWQHLDIEKDTVPAISLDRAYKEFLKNKKGKDIIVAVLDTKVDIYHEDLKNQIYKNPNEIDNNGIDDDHNGYVDDIYGWNFLGNEKGEDILYHKYEITRFIEKYKPLVSDSLQDLSKDSVFLKKYKLLEKEFNEFTKKTTENLNYAYRIIGIDTAVKKALFPYFGSSKYTIADLDSLKKKYPNNRELHSNISKRHSFIKYDFTEEYLYSNLDKAINLLNLLKPTFNERALINDTLIDFSKKYYGNPIVYGKVPFEHSTGVCGILGANRRNKIGIQGISNHIKIMPVVMVATGDEHDKDVATAIRYAVDNGASIINMSWAKNKSLYKEKVYEAIRYAEQHDVLLVTGAGNDNVNIDIDYYYPNDYDNAREISSNFLSVGASTYNIKKLKASFSNYGKEQVDIFAPGNTLYVTSAYSISERYKFSRGTSYSSPIVAGVAALVRSYYPSLTASEVKHIIMESGVEYTIPVKVPTKEDKERTIPFNELSKSGKIVNAYNALLMAEEISGNK